MLLGGYIGHGPCGSIWKPDFFGVWGRDFVQFSVIFGFFLVVIRMFFLAVLCTESTQGHALSVYMSNLQHTIK